MTQAPTVIPMDLVDGEKEDLLLTEDDIALLERDHGLVRIRDGARKAGLLAKSVENIGTIRISSGYVLIHKDNLTVMSRELAKRAAEPEVSTDQLLELAGAASKLGNTVAKLTQAETERSSLGPNKKGVRRPTFPIGKPVVITQNNYYGEKKPD